MAKYLITGGAGFIGSHLCQALVARGDEVVVIDDLSSGTLSNLESIRQKIAFIQGDIRDLATLQQATDGVQYVLHQAAIRAVPRSIEDPRTANDVNITGTLNVLLAARDAGVKRVVFASSSSVYGNRETERNIESAMPVPESPYALTKLTGEYYCRLFSNLYGLSTVSLRYFNVFGPRQDPKSKYSMVIAIFIQQLLAGETPEIHGDGHQSRDFTYIDNIVQANLLAATAKDVKSGEAYNIGGGENTSVLEYYEMLQDMLAIRRPPNFTASRAGDVRRTHADISAAKHDLGYQPRVSFKEGLAESIEWYRKNLT